MLVARTFAQNKLALIGVAVVVIIILFSFLGPLLDKTDQLNPNLIAVNMGPGGGHPLGTDSSGFRHPRPADEGRAELDRGRDRRRSGLDRGGLIYGAIAGYFGGALDSVLMRVVDIGLAIPIVFLFIFMAQIYKPSLTLLIVLLTFVSWLIPARLVRGETLSLRTREYVQAVQVMGGRSGRIILRHIIPNTIGVIMVTVTFQIANAILTLAVLQYLGFGLPPTTPDLGLDAVRRHHLPPGRLLVAGLPGADHDRDHGRRVQLHRRRPPRRLRRPPPRTLDRMTRLLEVEDLKTQIRLRRGTVHAVDGLSFEVEAGETLGIVGESGCGKTMAAMSIMRLLPRGGFIAGGEIRLEGRDLAKISPAELRKVRGNEVGMVFQDPMNSLNPTMTIGRQIAEVVTTHRDVSKAQALERAAEVLDLVGLPRPKERLKDYPHQLSGGLRQRVMIAMALACDPKLLIADEPTTALDVTIQEQILSLLDRIKRELGMGIILITHDMGVIAGRADRVLVMYAGRKVETAETRRAVQERPPPVHGGAAGLDPAARSGPEPGALLDSRAFRRICAGRRWPVVSRHGARSRPSSAGRHDPPLGGDDPNHPFACFHPRELVGHRHERPWMPS